MIIIRREGGLGNQLFQCALGLHLSRKHNTKLKFDMTWLNQNKFTYEAVYGLNDFGVNFELINSDELKFNTEKNLVYFRGRHLTIVGERLSSFNPEILDTPDNIFLHGYWQSYKYFEDSADFVREKLIFKGQLDKISTFWKEQIEATECAVSLHIRRSSYMRPAFRKHAGILSLEYYKDCVDIIKEHCPNLTIFVFTNDLDWARQNLRLGVATKFVEGCERDVDELYLMSLCKHNIIANSTFSWWGAWLNPKPDKMVLAPAKWHQDNWGGDTVIPEEWIKVPTKFEFMEPVLSIIVFIKDNLNTVDLVFESIIGQNFKDYEVIVITTVEDESGQIAHRYAAQNNCMVLNTSKETTKETAWNLGLKCANGEYVMFLTGKNVITPRVVRLVCECWDFNSKDNLNRDNYLTQENREKFAPNIIWGSKLFEEDPNGEVTIPIFNDKLFTLRDDFYSFPQKITDDFFNLSTVDSQEFKFLFAYVLGTFIENKIFKRKFLQENDIYFRENSFRAENLFLLNALLLSEKVTIATEIFAVQLLR